MGIVFFFAITSLPILRLALGHLGHGSQTSLECVTLQRLWVGCSAPTLYEICIVQVFPLSPEEKLRPSHLLTPQYQFLLLAALLGLGLTSHSESELKTSWSHIKTEKKEIIFKLKIKLTKQQNSKPVGVKGKGSPQFVYKQS